MHKDGLEIAKSGAVALVVSAIGVACYMAFGCISVPKEHGIAEARTESPGTSMAETTGDTATIAGVAVKADRDTASTDASTTTQSGKTVTQVKREVTAGGNVNSDDWTSRILASSAFLGLMIYIGRHRADPVKKAFDYFGGRKGE